jgi:hypothetical protein
MSFFRKKYSHEVFLSHAVEDRAAIADELYAKLNEAGIKVWYSANALTTGEDLKKEIEQAIDDSRFGVVIFSKGSIHRPWMVTEVNWLELKEDDNTKAILPFLYDLTIEEFAGIYPRLASRFCIHSRRGMDFAVDKILEPIRIEREAQRAARRKRWLITTTIALIMIFASLLARYIVTHDRPTDLQIETAITDRIQKVINLVDGRYANPFKRESSVILRGKVDSVRTAYQNFKSYFRNEYEFDNGLVVIHARKNVEDAIGENVVELADLPGYGMDSLDIYWSKPIRKDGFQHSSFSLINKRPVNFKWAAEKKDDSYLVKVNYSNGIQYIKVTLTMPPTSAGTKRHEMTLVGFPPEETYYFEKGTDGEWYFKGIQ